MTVGEHNVTPGEMLAAAREKASMSLEQIAENTRIAPNMLRAIELDEYHKISGELYVKSFLRSYAQAVDLEPEDLIELYLAYTGASSVDSAGNQPAGWEEQDVKITKVGLPWGRILLFSAVVVVGVVLFIVLTGDDSVEQIDPVEVEGTSAISTPEETPLPVKPDSTTTASAEGDTLSLGWQMEEPAKVIVEDTPESPPPGSGKTYLPRAFQGNSRMTFLGGKHWAYVVRLISEQPGDFAVKRDAESSFSSADFPAAGAQAKPLPSGNVVAGQVYAVRRGFVVYWGADDHLSLRLGHIEGVEVSFNGQVQDVARFNAGEEILLDSSRLAGPAGN